MVGGQGECATDRYPSMILICGAWPGATLLSGLNGFCSHPTITSRIREEITQHAVVFIDFAIMYHPADPYH